MYDGRRLDDHTRDNNRLFSIYKGKLKLVQVNVVGRNQNKRLYYYKGKGIKE